jgi:Flp pilus assembly protein TadD
LDGLGLLAQAAGKWDEAARSFGQAKAIYANDPVADRGLAEARVAGGDQSGALAALDDLHRLLPNDTDAWVESGKLRLKSHDAAAAADFQQARKLGSSDPELLRLLIETYRSQGRIDDERSLLDDLVSQGVADARHYARRAELREATDLPSALADLRKANSLDPLDLDIQEKLAALTAKSGDLSGAIGLYRALAAKKPALKPELAALEKRAGLSGKPLRGTVNQINQGLSSDLTALFHQLLKQTPGLQGGLKIRVIVGSDGRAQSEELLENSVRSPELAANLRWNAHDARYPPTAARYVFKFALK